MRSIRFATLTTLGAGLSLLPACGGDVLEGITCPEGEHVEAGVCVSDCDAPFIYSDGACVCEDGYEELDGTCVPICADGWHLEGGFCAPNCDTGWIWENGECVLDCAEGLTAVDGECILVCAEGFEPVGGVCLPVCEPGFLRINGECLPLGAIEGTVCNHTLGRWLEGVTATLTLNDSSILSDVTDVDGYYRIDGVPPGVYYVDFAGPTGYSNVLPVAVASGVVSFLGDETCQPPPGHLKGAVCNQAVGTWVQGATVVLNDTAGSMTTTDQFGAFMFFSVPVGDYVLTITYPGGAVENRNASVFSSQITDTGPATCEPPPDPCAGAAPVAIAGVDQNAVPDQTVQLNGSTSFDPAGQGLTYSWRVASRPIGSTAPLSDPAAANPTILADISGDFVVCLVVTDTDDCDSLEDCMNIHVAPQVGFHIELVWDTNNVDVDTHFIRPTGTWFTNPNDCYFANMTPDWGPSGADGLTSNNPRLDVDNVVGYGPENINMDSLWDDGPYKVGIHYWANHGGGATVSRVRIYVDGVLQYEANSRSMVNREFWWVADVNVSGNGTAIAITPLNTYATY